MAALKAELRSMRDQQTRLNERLERLERSNAVLRARSSPQAPAAVPSSQAPSKAGAPAAPAPESSSGVSVPDLTVVKLKPKADPAPPLPTKVAVVEPDQDDVEMFVSSSPASSEPAAPASAPAPNPAVTAALDAEFEQAVAALRTGNVEPGVAKLQSFAELNPRHPRADNALYFAGLGLIGMNDHEGAAQVFERLIETYPAGDAVLDGMLRLAECRLKLNQRDDARALYTRVITQFPGTAAATQAEQRLASLSH